MTENNIQNGSAYDKLHILALQEISKIIASTRDVDLVLIEILKALSSLLGFEYSTISLVDDRTKTISTKHGIWGNKIDAFPEWLQLSSYQLTDIDIQAFIVRKGKYEIIEKWDDRFNQKIWDKFQHEKLIRIYMPINLLGHTIGTIEAGYEKQNKPRIYDEEIKLLETFANEAAIAIENAAQFESIKNLQRQVANAEKLDILSSISDQLAHRINNAAGTIPSLAREAKRCLSESALSLSDPKIERALQALSLIESHSSDLIKMASLVRSPYTLEEAAKGPANVNNEILSALETAAPPKHIEAATELQASLPSAQVNPVLLKDVFFNFIKNAIEAMDADGGKLRIKSELFIPKGNILVTISDTGSGISKEVKERLFKPFSSTKPNLGGMGMAIFNSRNILQAIGGDITLESSGKNGTTFSIYIPIIPSNA